MSFPLQLTRFYLKGQQVELFVPDPGAIKEAYQKGKIPFPYWSRVWPAALALAQFLVEHPEYTQDRKVMELGAGLGLPSIVAARQAASVLCTDYVPEAVAIVQQTAVQNKLANLTAALIDWNRLPENLDADVLLLSDINYEPAAFDKLMEVVQRFLEKETLILLSTPQRLMAKAFISRLQALCTSQEEVAVTHEGKEVLMTVMVLGNKGTAGAREKE